MARIDLHVKILNDRVVRRAKQRGLHAIVYAPHFTQLPEIERRARAFSDDELQIFPAREVFAGPWSNRRHVLAIGLSDPVPDFLTLDATFEELERQGAAVLVPHPTYATISLSAAEIRTHQDRLDAIEVYNPKTFRWHNRRAKTLAADLDLAVFGSSYAHLPWIVGEVWMDTDCGIRALDDLVSAMKAGLHGSIHHGRGTQYLASRFAEIAHVGWENSWEKFHRVVLSGEEPTHPSNPIYGGQFEERSVY